MAKATTKKTTKAPSKTKATKAKTAITKADLDILKSRGFIPGRPDTIPRNISPGLKAQLLKLAA